MCGGGTPSGVYAPGAEETLARMRSLQKPTVPKAETPTVILPLPDGIQQHVGSTRYRGRAENRRYVGLGGNESPEPSPEQRRAALDKAHPDVRQTLLAAGGRRYQAGYEAAPPPPPAEKPRPKPPKERR